MPDTDLPPTTAQIRAQALAARDALPDPFRSLAADVAVLVEDFPDDALLDAMGIDSGWDLTGVYDGVPVTEKSTSHAEPVTDTVRLFRLPILFEWIERGDVALDALVAHVLVHELAHHFGWSDDDIAAIDRWWE